MKIEGIVLAAGLSMRMNDFKLLMMMEDKTVIERTIESMVPFCERIIVVVGHAKERLIPILRAYNQVDIVFNDDYPLGMFSSIKTGIGEFAGEGLFLLPGDMPFVKQDTYKAILTGTGDVRIPSFKGRAGHPLFLTGEIARGVLSTNCETLRAYLMNHDKSYIEVDDEGVIIDLDTRDDYSKYVGGGV